MSLRSGMQDRVTIYSETNLGFLYFSRTVKSPYTISVPLQLALCIRRGMRRLQGDKSFFIVTVLGNFFISLILGSVFYNLPDTTESFTNRCILLFFALLFNALNSSLEVCEDPKRQGICVDSKRLTPYTTDSILICSTINSRETCNLSILPPVL